MIKSVDINMNITKESPIIIDFVPTPKSIVALRFKLRGLKEKIKINVDVNILYKDPSINGRIFLLNPGIQDIYTNADDRIYTLKFNISEFKDNIISFVRMAIDSIDDIDHEIIVEYMKLICAKDMQDDSLEQILISKKAEAYKEIEKDKEIEKSKDIIPTEIISPQAAMVIQHTQPKTIKKSPWTLMTTRN